MKLSGLVITEGTIPQTSLNVITIDIKRLTNRADAFEDSLENHKNSTGFGKYGNTNCVSTDSFCPVSKVLSEFRSQLDGTIVEASKLGRDTVIASNAALVTKRRAEESLENLQKVVKDVADMLVKTNASIDSFIGSTMDGDAALKKAEGYLKEMRAINFTLNMASSIKEKISAENATKIADALKGLVENLEKSVSKLNILNNLTAAFKNVKNESGMAKTNADNAIEPVNMAKAINNEVIKDLKMTEEVDAKNNATFDDAEKILKKADDAVKMAIDSFEVIKEKMKGPLAELLDKLRKYSLDLKTGLDISKAKVKEAVMHAATLKSESIELAKGLQNTAKFAKTAMDAAQRYALIVKAIADAHQAAVEAQKTADDSKRKTVAAKSITQALKGQIQLLGTEVKMIAEDVKNLKIPLSATKLSVDKLKMLRERIQGQLDVVKNGFKSLDKNLGENAKQVGSKSDEPIAVGETGKVLAKKIVEQVADDNKEVERLKNKIRDINANISGITITPHTKNTTMLDIDVQKVIKKKLKIEETIKNNVTYNIKYIKFLLANSRSIVDNIDLAMTFNKASQLVLDAPKSSYDPQSSVVVSLSFTRKGDEDAMMLFMGNGNDPNAKGYVAFDISNKKFRFHSKMDTGGVSVLESSVNIERKFWYKVMATRKSKYSTLRIVKKDFNGILISDKSVRENYTTILPASLTLGKSSDVFLGSMNVTKDKPGTVVTEGFVGCMEKLYFNDDLMGLWNFKTAINVDGCKRKSRPTSTGQYCFKRNGFIDLSITSDVSFARVNLNFITLEKNGLIILVMDLPEPTEKKKAFFALEIKNGFLVSKYDFGGGLKEIVHTSAGMLNDGKSHDFKMKKGRAAAGGLKVVKFYIDSVENTKKELSAEDTIFGAKKAYAGGIPMKVYLPNDNFDEDNGFTGCISAIKFKGNDENLNTISNGLNYKHGLEPLIGRTASFPISASYLEIDACTVTADASTASSFQFAFQTLKNGLLLTSKDLELSLDAGKLKMTVTLNGAKQSVESKNTESLLDGEWHKISVTNQFGKKIVFGVDNEFYTVESSPETFSLNLNGKMSIGGGAGRNGFNGNIREVSCMDSETNLASGTPHNQVKIGSLKLIPPLPVGYVPTTAAPITTTAAPITTSAAPITTSAAPITTSAAPITTSAAPITTTAAPITTTAAPITTTAAPITTTAAPITTTAAPITTTLSILDPKAEPICEPGPKGTPNVYGFGLSKESYMTFDVIKATLDLRKHAEYEFYFYTLETDGILLSANMRSQYDYDTIYLDNGKVSYIFNAGSGSLLLQVDQKLNDGKWHKVRTERNVRKGSLIIDDSEIVEGSLKRGATQVNGVKKIFVGGVPTGELTPLKIQSSNVPFKGAIKNIKILKKVLPVSSEMGITDAYNPGLVKFVQAIHFGKDGGYFEKRNTGEVGINYQLEMDVRSLHSNGSLFYAVGGKDGMHMFIKPDGTLRAECDNGGGLFAVEVKPKQSICNGQFHQINLVKKGKMLTLTVDGDSKSVTSLGPGSQANTGRSPVYIGGIPVGKHPPNYNHYHGCINNLKIKGKPVDLYANSKFGGSVMRGCAA